MARSGEGISKTPRVLTLAAVFIVILALRLLRDVLIPLALAVLLCFVLAPVASRLEKLRLGRIGSVLVVMVVALSIIGVLGYVMSLQLLDLAERTPQYRDNIVYKIQSLRTHGSSSLDKAAETFKEVSEAVSEPATTQSTRPTEAEQALGISPPPVIPRESPVAAGDAEEAQEASLPGTSPDKPVWVAPINPPQTPAQMVSEQLGKVLGPLGTAGLVIVFVIFMLFQREDLRDRLIRLIGHGQLQLTTTAFDDAGQRISRYLSAQAIINGSYGVAAAAGLWLIGQTLGDQPFPNFILWGVLCAVLRFVPYIGPWIAAAFPIAISFAVYKGSGVFIATCAWFIAVELLSNNFMEPWLYGSSTGMSAIAVLLAAVFWTFLWGPVGLLLATPLTVCLVVLGKHVPQLQFLDIMLGDEPVLSPPQRVYQRLLAQDEEEASTLVAEYLKEHTLEEVYDDVLIPALGMAEQDRHRGRLDDQRQRFIRAAMKNMIDELGDGERARTEVVGDAAPNNGAAATAGRASDSENTTPQKPSQPKLNRLPEGCVINVVCLPSHDEADEIIAMMLAQVLQFRGYHASAASVTSLAGEMMEMIASHDAEVICVSAMPPAAVTHARYLCKRIHVKYAELKMVVGLWTYRGEMKKARDRITCVGSVQVVTNLKEALAQIHQMVQPLMLRAAREP